MKTPIHNNSTFELSQNLKPDHGVVDMAVSQMRENINGLDQGDVDGVVHVVVFRLGVHILRKLEDELVVTRCRHSCRCFFGLDFRLTQHSSCRLVFVAEYALQL